MDVDCDGLDYKCKVCTLLSDLTVSLKRDIATNSYPLFFFSLQGNPDGQPNTNFGALAAYEVPFIVIPDKFATTYESVLPGNNIGAVIW